MESLTSKPSEQNQFAELDHLSNDEIAKRVKQMGVETDQLKSEIKRFNSEHRNSI